MSSRSLNSDPRYGAPSTSYGAVDTHSNQPLPREDDLSNVRFRPSSREEDGGDGCQGDETTPLLPGNSTEEDSICVGVMDCCRDSACGRWMDRRRRSFVAGQILIQCGRGYHNV